MFHGEMNTPRVMRHAAEHRKLQSKADQIAHIHPAIIRHSIDHAVTESQGKAGFSPHDLAAIQLWTRTCAFTLILVPLRLWYRPLWRRRALELKRFLGTCGKRCVVAPASYLDRQPRLQNARLVAASRQARVSATDRMIVMAKLDEAATLSLTDASMLVHAADPAAAVLSLVSQRALSLDPDQTIGPHTVLSMRAD